MKGYSRRDPVSHRVYNRKTSLNRYHKTGEFSMVSGGSGHRAGERWAEQKGIDPHDRVRKYSKNSPSFDEGVYAYKQRKKTLMAKMEAMAKKMKR